MVGWYSQKTKSKAAPPPLHFFFLFFCSSRAVSQFLCVSQFPVSVTKHQQLSSFKRKGFISLTIVEAEKTPSSGLIYSALQRELWLPHKPGKWEGKEGNRVAVWWERCEAGLRVKTTLFITHSLGAQPGPLRSTSMASALVMMRKNTPGKIPCELSRKKDLQLGLELVSIPNGTWVSLTLQMFKYTTQWINNIKSRKQVA